MGVAVGGERERGRNAGGRMTKLEIRNSNDESNSNVQMIKVQNVTGQNKIENNEVVL